MHHPIGFWIDGNPLMGYIFHCITVFFLLAQRTNNSKSVKVVGIKKIPGNGSVEAGMNRVFAPKP
jgi:hypothetical protein